MSSSSLLHRILLSLVSMQLSSCTKSPETWSSFSTRVLIGRLTILEYSFRISLSSLQLVGMPFFCTSFFFSSFFSAASREAALGRFLSSFFSSTFSLGSLRVIFRSFSSKERYPLTPSRSIQETIFFISGSPILDKQSEYLDLMLSKVRLSLFLARIQSKDLEVMVPYEESSSSSSRSSCRRQLCFLVVTSTGCLEARALCKKSWQVISGVFLMRSGSCSPSALPLLLMRSVSL